MENNTEKACGKCKWWRGHGAVDYAEGECLAWLHADIGINLRLANWIQELNRADIMMVTQIEHYCSEFELRD